MEPSEGRNRMKCWANLLKCVIEKWEPPWAEMDVARHQRAVGDKDWEAGRGQPYAGKMEDGQAHEVRIMRRIMELASWYSQASRGAPEFGAAAPIVEGKWERQVQGLNDLRPSPTCKKVGESRQIWTMFYTQLKCHLLTSNLAVNLCLELIPSLVTLAIVQILFT